MAVAPASIDMLLAKNRAGGRKQWLTEEGNKAEIRSRPLSS